MRCVQTQTALNVSTGEKKAALFDRSHLCHQVRGSRSCKLLTAVLVWQTNIVSQVLFLLPFYSDATSTSNVLLFWSRNGGDFLGRVIATTALKTRVPGTRLSRLSLPPKTVILSGAAVVFVAALLFIAVNLFFFGCEWLCNLPSFVFGLGGGLILASLPPYALRILASQVVQYQAIVYVRLQLAGSLSFAITTVLCNLVLQRLSKLSIRTVCLPEEIISKGLSGVQKCAGGLSSQERDAKQAAMLRILRYFSVAIFLATWLLAALPIWMDNDCNFEVEINTGSGYGDEIIAAESQLNGGQEDVEEL